MPMLSRIEYAIKVDITQLGYINLGVETVEIQTKDTFNFVSECKKLWCLLLCICLVTGLSGRPLYF